MDDSFDCGYDIAIAEMKSSLEPVLAVLQDSPELNMQNYTEDEVAELNDAVTEAFNLLEGVYHG